MAAAMKKRDELRATAKKKEAEKQLSAAMQSGDVAALEKAIAAAKAIAGVDVAAAQKKLAELRPPAVPRPPDAAVRRLLGKVGVGSLEEAVCAKELHWEFKGLDDEDAKVVAYMVATSGSLTGLHLRNNYGIGDVGAKAIAEALRANSSLRELWLDSNMIGDEGAKALRGAVRFRRGFKLHLNTARR